QGGMTRAEETHHVQEQTHGVRAQGETTVVAGRKPHSRRLPRPPLSHERLLGPEAARENPPSTHHRDQVHDEAPVNGDREHHECGKEQAMMGDPILHYALAASLDPRARKYLVPRMAS